MGTDIKRALSGRNFLAGLMGMVLVILLASAENIILLVREPRLLYNGYHAQFVLSALQSDWVIMALPILSAMPYTTAFVEDVRSGFLKQYLPRSGKKAYIRGKLFACGLSGGLVLFAGALLAYTLAVLVFTPMELALGPDEVGQPYFIQFLIKAAMLFIYGAFWSLAGFTFAALTMNTYMAYASPFILYYLLVILKERYFVNLYVLYPKEWLYPSDKWVLGCFGVILLLSELMILLCLVFIVIVGRRLSDV